MRGHLDGIPPFVAVILTCLLSGSYPTSAQDSDTVICGGFVQSEYPLDYSKVEVHLLDKHGNLKYQAGCSASNGNYEVPIFDKKGDFILTVYAPSGISFEPEQLQLQIDGKNDPCSKQENLNFRFAGFSCAGRIQSAGGAEGPAGVTVKLYDSNEKMIASTTSEAGGRFQIKRLLPGTYTLEATHPQFQLVQPKVPIVIAHENLEIPDQSLVVNGYSLTGNVKSSGEPISGVSFFLYSKTAKPSDVRGCEKPTLKENQAEVGNLQHGTLLCSVKSDASGKFAFRSLASSRYTLVPEYNGGSTKYDIEPTFYEFAINHEPLEIPKLFEVKGFTAYGSVLTSKNGQGVPSAEVYINNTLVTKTDKKGQFQLDKTITGWYKIEIKKEYYDFPTVYTKITPAEAVVPPVVARSMMVCGSVTTLRPLNRMVSFDAVEVKTGISRDTVVRDGKFCILLEAGEHKVSIFDAPQSTKEQKLVFSPAEKIIHLKDFPITDLVFEQVLGTVSGQIRCIDECPKDLRVSLLTGSGESFTKVDGNSENKASGSFKFSNVDLGTHVVKIVDSQSKRSCWDMVQKTIELTVTKPTVTVGFVQTGYVFEIWSSHDTMISYKLVGEGSSEPQTATIKGKFTELCLPKPGQYTIQPKSCHKFEQDTYTFDTENPGKLSMQAVAHSTNISVNTDDDRMSFKLRIKKRSDGSSSILSPSGAPRQLTPELFQYNFLEYFAASEDLTVHPSSDTLLFKPVQAELSVTDRCETNALVLEAFKGVLITGSLTPPVADADVTVTTEDDVLHGKTDSSGNYSLGPVARSSLKDIVVEKRGYQLHRVEGTNNFKTVKLSEIRIRTLDANGEPVPGVLVSISSTAGIRTSNLTDTTGTISFVSFAPGEYVIRPMVKEYKFDPSSKSITLTQGQTAEVSWNGVRIAYSALGKVGSLGGDPEVGLIVEAVSEPPCPQMQEECVTGNDGHFRISGLKAGCDYEVRAKSGELGRFDIKWISPANRTMKMGTDNIVGLSFLAFRGFNEAEFTGRIETTKEFLPTLKVCLYRTDRPDEAQQCVSFTVNPMFYLNAVALDNRAYFLRLESTLSNKDYVFSPSDVPVTANVTLLHVVLPFVASQRMTVETLRTLGICLSLFLAFLRTINRGCWSFLDFIVDSVTSIFIAFVFYFMYCMCYTTAEAKEAKAAKVNLGCISLFCFMFVAIPNMMRAMVTGADKGFGLQTMRRMSKVPKTVCHGQPHRGNEMGNSCEGGFVADPIRSMSRDHARMENMMFGGFGGANVGSMVDCSMRTTHNFIERDGQQLVQFQFDVRGFKPEDISIKTTSGVVTVTARHEDKGEDHAAIREFRCMVTVPSGMQIDAMKSRLAPNGVLSLEAPYSAPTNKDGDHCEIPIQHDTSSSNKGKR